MRLLVGEHQPQHGCSLDFEAPLKLPPDKLNRFLDYLKNEFSVVEVESAGRDAFRSDRLGDRRFLRQWTDKELRILARSIALEPATTEEVGRKLARGWMSVDIKRGEIAGALAARGKKEGISVFAARTDEEKRLLEALIERYLAERKAAKARHAGPSRLDHLLSRREGVLMKIRGHKAVPQKFRDEKWGQTLAKLETDLAAVETEIEDVQGNGDT